MPHTLTASPPLVSCSFGTLTAEASSVNKAHVLKTPFTWWAVSRKRAPMSLRENVRAALVVRPDAGVTFNLRGTLTERRRRPRRRLTACRPVRFKKAQVKGLAKFTRKWPNRQD